MKSRLNAIVAASVIVLSLAGHAQAQQAPPATQGAGANPATSAAFTDGEVRKVDKEAKKITIKHGEIKNLEMPPMTMVFAVKDNTLLSKVKAGDKIQFKAVDEGGKLTVVAVEPAN